MSVRDWAEVIGLLIGLGTVLTALWKYVISPLWRWGKAVSDVHSKVQRIWAELQPNGGSSIRDQLNRQTEILARVETRQVISEQIDKQVFASLSLGVFRADEHGRITEVNRNYQRMTGRTFEELEGSNWSNCIYPEDRDAIYDEWVACVEEGRQFERQFRFVRPDGLLQSVHGRACVLTDRNLKVIGWFGTVEKQGDAEHPGTSNNHHKV